MGKARDPEPLEGVLKRIIKNLGKEDRLTEEGLAKAWKDAVGKKAASHTRPRALRKAQLTINVDRSSWLYELTTKKKEILKKLEGKLKGKKLREIRFRIGEIE